MSGDTQDTIIASKGGAKAWVCLPSPYTPAMTALAMEG